MSWITTSFSTLGLVLLSTLGIYISLIILTRLGGLRSFSKMSSFDFAVTIAIGTVIASTVLTRDPPLLRGIFALAVLYGIQITVASLRTRAPLVSRMVDNAPLLLMAGSDVLHENLRKANITESDLRGKLREANVIDIRQVRAVVFEATGDVSVLHASPEGPDLDRNLLQGVQDSERLFEGDPPANQDAV